MVEEEWRKLRQGLEHNNSLLEAEIKSTRHALEVAQKAMVDHDREIKAFQDRVETQRDEVLKLQDDLLQGANREDQLRAELEEAKRFRASVSKTQADFDRMIGQTIDERDRFEECVTDAAAMLGCENEWSNLHDHTLCVPELITKLRADNEALRARLKTAVVLAHEAREMLTSAEWHFERHSIAAPKFARDLKLFREDSDTFLASGSSTGEACRCGSGAHPRRCAVHPERYAQHCAELSAEAEPAAPARIADNAPRCSDTSCRFFGQRHWTPHEAREPAVTEPAPTPTTSLFPCSKCDGPVSVFSSSTICDKCQRLWNEAYGLGREYGRKEGATLCPTAGSTGAGTTVTREPAPASAQGLAPTFDQLVERVGPLPATGLASAQGTTESVRVAELRGRLEAQRGKIEDLDKRVVALASRKVCRWCQEPLLPENRGIADGCPCNSGRGINHGLVAPITCTCSMCDQASTGASRWRPAAPPQPAPVEGHAFHDYGPNGNVCRAIIGEFECGQPRSAAVHGTGDGNG